MGAPRKHEPCVKICEECGDEFEATTPYAITKQRCCGITCSSKAVGRAKRAKRTERPCLNCDTTMAVLPCHLETQKFCSNSCKFSYNNRGERNPAWKGGDALGKYWKRKCRERDDFTCQFPDCLVRQEGRGTHAHHKVPRSVGGPDSLANLVTLCSRHHREMERRLLKALIEKHPRSTKIIAATLW